MYDEMLKKIDLNIDEASIFELFEYHKKLAVIEKAFLMVNENVEDVRALIDRVQENIIFKRESK